jgi:diguanylate cyclase (GGDEF)-like protein/PAS domain S-box-containing protein
MKNTNSISDREILTKFLLPIISMLIMGVLINSLYPTYGPIIGSLIAIPALISSWLKGWQTGLVASFLGYIVIRFVFYRFGNTSPSLLVNGAVLMGISVIVGWLRHSSSQAVKQTTELLQRNRNLLSVLSENKDFSDALTKQTIELSMILDASKAMSSSLDLEQVIQTIAEEITLSLDASGCAISNWDKPSDSVVTWIEYRSDSSDFVDKPGISYALDNYPATRKVLERGTITTIYRDDPTADAAEVSHLILQETNSLLMVPIKYDEIVIGLVEVDDNFDRTFTEDEIENCIRLVEHAANAIYNAKSFEEIQYRLKEQTLLAKAVTTITASVNPDNTLKLLCEQLSDALDATSVYIALFNEKTNYSTVVAEYIAPVASESEKISDIGARYLEEDQKFLEFIRSGVPTIDQINDHHLGALEKDHMSEFGGKTVLYLPLRIQGMPKGFIELWESRQERTFSDNEINLGKALAEHAAVVLENAYLHKKASEAEQRFRSIAKNSPDHVLLLDKNLNILYVNYPSPGLSTKQLIGTPLYSYVEEDQQESVKEILQRVLETTKSNTYETKYYDPVGDKIYYESRVSALISSKEVDGLVVNSRDISHRKELEKRLEHQALHDPLTELPNKRFLKTRLKELGELVVRQKLRLEVAIIDLDNFKDINDEFGHAVGDQVLAELGKRLKENTRTSDFAARYGGDEFIILFVDQLNGNDENLHTRLESLLNSPITIGDHHIRIAGSIGYCSFLDGEFDEEAIIKQADDAMYKAKKGKKHPGN